MKKLKHLTLSFIDFFHPVVRKIMPLQTFRYAFCGTTNMVLGWVLFGFCNHFVLHSPDKEAMVNILGLFSVKAYYVSYFFALVFTFPIGFMTNKFLVFQESTLRSHIQLFRYGLMMVFSVVFSLGILPLLIEKLHIWATPANIIGSLILAVISFFVQKFFSFGSSSKEEIPVG